MWKQGCVVSAVLAVATTAAFADDVKVAITVSGGATSFNPDSGSVKAGDNLVISCPTGTACAGLVVNQNNAAQTPTGSNDQRTYTVAGAGDVVLSYGGKDATFKLGGGGGGGGGGGAAVIGAEPCSEVEIPLTKSLVVDTDGNVLQNRLQGFTEEDTLTVVAMGPKSAIAGLKVSRRSAFRDVTVLHILGDTSAVSGGPKQGAGAAPEEIGCKRFQLADFSSGRGAIAVSNPAQKVDSEIEFSVGARYQGMFTVGYIASKLNQPEFFLRVEDGITRVRRKPSEPGRSHFTLMYSAFLPLHDWFPNTFGRRDWNQAFGVGAGVLLDDLANKNILLGLNIGPLNGFSINAGVHIGDVKRLAAGLGNGSALDAATDAEIPIDTKLSSSLYIGIGLDIRVATKLFFSLFTKS